MQYNFDNQTDKECVNLITNLFVKMEIISETEVELFSYKLTAIMRNYDISEDDYSLEFEETKELRNSNPFTGNKRSQLIFLIAMVYHHENHAVPCIFQLARILRQYNCYDHYVSLAKSRYKFNIRHGHANHPMVIWICFHSMARDGWVLSDLALTYYDLEAVDAFEDSCPNLDSLSSRIFVFDKDFDVIAVLGPTEV
jgi:hypothetical protein